MVDVKADLTAPITVLLVDDDEDLLEIGRDMLEVCGCRVVLAAGGEEAVELFKAHRGDIDVVLMDLSMPGMDGTQCMREIRRMDPSARIIISSGLGDDCQAEEVLAAGACAFLSKPYRMSEMVVKMREVLDLRR